MTATHHTVPPMSQLLGFLVPKMAIGTFQDQHENQMTFMKTQMPGGKWFLKTKQKKFIELNQVSRKKETKGAGG